MKRTTKQTAWAAGFTRASRERRRWRARDSTTTPGADIDPDPTLLRLKPHPSGAENSCELAASGQRSRTRHGRSGTLGMRKLSIGALVASLCILPYAAGAGIIQGTV